MIKFEERLPDYYVNNSRDFQLLCRIFDIFLGGCFEDAEKIQRSWSIETLPENLLPLYARRLGLILDRYVPPAILRNICRSYPSICRHKGTLQAVREAAYAVFSANQEVTFLEVRYDSGPDPKTQDPRIQIKSNIHSSEDQQYLEMLYPYILPAGVKCVCVLNIAAQVLAETVLLPTSTIYRYRAVGVYVSKVLDGVPGRIFPESNAGEKYWNVAIGADDKYYYNRVNHGMVLQTASVVEHQGAIINKDLESDPEQGGTSV